ncbi:hypothetical protein [Methanofollis ethanolicus]|uniref:hypothetical protein n=1 Tax=Methanofollis ethanolicus TaxID=488124 RepID=UPI00082CEC0B|nr:hypothetical protein [Methanofollis ethanolicus]
MRPAFERHTDRLRDEEILEIGSFVPEPLPDEEKARFSRVTGMPEAPETFPAVAIGWPETKNLARLLGRDDLKTIDPFVRADIKRYDFFLVRLCCSFLPESEETVLHSARFIVVLKPDERGRQPRVSTMYPRRVLDPVKETSRMGLNASLQFIPLVGATPAVEGAIETGVEYTKLVPKMVAAFNFDQSGALWDFERTDADELRGVRYMYLLARAPTGAVSLWARITLSAKVRFRDRLRNAVFAPWGRAAPALELNLLAERGRAVRPPAAA